MRGLIQSLTLRRRLLILYLALVLVPLLIMSLLLSHRARLMIGREVTQSSYRTLQQVANNIAYHTDAIVTASDTLARDTQLYSLLTDRSEGLWEQVQATLHLRKLIATAQSNLDVYRVRIFANSTQLFTHDQYNFFSIEDIDAQPWIAQTASGGRPAFWQTTYWTRYAAEGERAVLSLVRVLRDLSNFDQVLGYLLIDVQQSQLSQLLLDTSWAGGERLYVVDAAGIVLSSVEESRLGTAVHEGLLGEEPFEPAARVGIVSCKAGSLLTCAIQGTGWYLTTLLPASALANTLRTHEIGTLLLYAILTMIVVGLSTLTASAVFAHYITQRTRELVDTVHREGFSAFPQALPARDHPDALEQSVQGLILTLKQMADESYQEKLNAKRMELQLLQAQINPHFLYNAIDAIYWKAIRQDVPEIAQLLSVLARYFRLTLNKGRDVVPLGDEVALLRAYIALQKNRFDDRFSVAYEVEDEALSALLPKLTLQPLVENALIHGILKRDGPGTLVVTARREGGFLFCQVADDGAGLEAPVVFESTIPRKGYGLHNVNLRLALMFGQDAGLHVEPNEKRGTRVWFRVPAWEQEGSAL